MEEAMDELLRRFLQWFAEGDDDPAEDDPPEPPKTGEPPKDDEIEELKVDGLSEAELKVLVQKLDSNLKKSNKIARERLHEIMDKKAKMREIETKEEAKQRAEREEKEQYKQLYEEIKPKYEVLEKEVVKNREHLEREFEELKGTVPEDFKDLIPEEGDIRDKIKWIKALQKKIIKKEPTPPKEVTPPEETPPKKPNVGGGGNPPKKSGSEPTAAKSIEDQIKNAKTAKELEAILKAHGRSVQD